MANDYIKDPNFQDRLLRLVARDRVFMRQYANLVQRKDFEPDAGEARERFIVADIAIGYWEKYNEPISSLLLVEAKRFCERNRYPQPMRERLALYVRRVLGGRLQSLEAIGDRVVEYQRERLKVRAIRELLELQKTGRLSDEAWLKTTEEAVKHIRGARPTSDFFEGLGGRIDRRMVRNERRFPMFMIPPLDRLVKSIGRGHLGTVLAPWKRGKSLFLIWLTIAFTIQGLNVLYVTLEDPLDDVEDRFDAAITHVPIAMLKEKESAVKLYFKKFKARARGRLRIVDGTEGKMGVAEIQQHWDSFRRQGFLADAVIVDYDAEIMPSVSNSERRFQFEQVYTDLRSMASKNQVIVWTAAQTQRPTEDTKVLKGKHAAEDVNKIRKVTMALGLGKAEEQWGEDGVYLNVAAHRNDKAGVGCYIVGRRDRGLIFDMMRTRRAYLELGET